MSDEVENAIKNTLILPPLSRRLSERPKDERGYPIFFYVHRDEKTGALDYAMADRDRWRKCESEKLCWLCGGKLGNYLAYPCRSVGFISRIAVDPPMHFECAEWLCRGGSQICPRPEYDFESCMAIRVTGGHARITGRDRRTILRPGNPMEVHWFRQGRPATRAEVKESLAQGLTIILATHSSIDDEAAKLRAANDTQEGFDRAMMHLPRH